ncbi:RNA recognition motif domain-containing protein [Ditylenchus destructor]|nr:RNA recognition motif domain-containing protein [Ditylenchus destructor]
MDPQSIFRMVSRSRLPQTYLRNVSNSRRHLCVLGSTQLSNQIPSSSLIQEETKLRRYSSFRETPMEFSSNKSNKHLPDVVRTLPDEFIFSPKRHYDEDRTIFVGGLSKFTTAQSLYKHFFPYGNITGCSLARNEKTGASMEYGFVEFELVSQAKNASELSPHVIDNQEVNVNLKVHEEDREKLKLFVGRLSKETSAETLREYFSKFGQVAECTIPRNEVNRSRGFGFLTYKFQESIDNVLKSAPHCIDNKTVYVDKASVHQKELTLFVGKLSPNTTNESLHAFYSRFGQLANCYVKFDHQTGQQRGFGYVEFRSQEGLDAALAEQPHSIDGIEVVLDYTTPTFTVMVTNFIPNIRDEALNDFFSRYGELRRCEILETSPGARTGFVEFRYEKDLLKALADRPHIISGIMVNTRQKDEQFVVYVGNLPPGANDDLLFETFSRHGKIVYWEVKRDHNTNRSLRYGFVSFEKAEEAVEAINGGPYILNGKKLRVECGKTLPLSKKLFK